jgi:DNA polymerase-3 subunit gamma/tau
MGNVLYRKYRSKTLTEIVGQPHITDTLSNAIKQGDVAHAYLFTGPRGVGKTSIARILAREVNNLSYEEADNHLDIIEIDAASNRRIDEIRELRDKVNNAPAQAKYKVYIIDEVHMLTKEAFNALLKTLEEPPEHAIFILATTEVHKLPDTIVSRTQKFTFKPVREDEVKNHLASIAKQEKIAISDDALLLIARHGQGSFRDSISLLDQMRYVVSESGEINIKDIRVAIGSVPDDSIARLLDLVYRGSVTEVLKTIDEIHESGFSAPQVASALAMKLRRDILREGKVSLDKTGLLKKLSEVSASIDSRVSLEIALLEYGLGQELVTSTKEKQITEPRKKGSRNTSTNLSEVKASEQPAVKINQNDTLQKPSKEKIEAPIQKESKTPLKQDDIWSNVLKSLKGKHNTLYGMARMAIPRIDEDTFVLECKYAFHEKRLSDNHHKKIISDAVALASGQSFQIRCVLADKKESKKDSDRPAISNSPASVETINNIFGSSEVLDS